MKNIQDINTLRTAIKELEVQKMEQGQVLRLQLHAVMEGLKPSAIISTTFKQAFKSPDVKNGLLKSGLLFLAGKVIPGGPIVQLLMGNAASWGADKFTKSEGEGDMSPAELLLNKARGFVGNLFRKKEAIRE